MRSVLRMFRMSDYEYAVLDAFADNPFTGNPAGVVLDAGRLSDAALQAVAREINLSETVFILPATQPDAAVRFRVFTPSAERTVPGHSTLAGVTALLDAGRFVALLDEPGTQLPIETQSGTTIVRAERIGESEDTFVVWVMYPGLMLKRFPHDVSKTAGLLGMDPTAIDQSMPAMKTQDDDLILFVESFQALMEAKPDFASLAEFSRRRKVRTWCLSTLESLTASVHVHSRCFAPVDGINEDSVTAGVHGPLAAYLVIAEQIGIMKGQAAVSCMQSDSTGRAGLVRALVSPGESGGYQAWIGGQCFASLSGQVHIPAQW